MTRRLMCLLVLATFAVLASWPSGQARAEEAKKMSLDDAFKAVAAYKFGQSRECQTVVEDAVRDSAAKPDDRAALAKRLAGLLSAADATLDAKQFACRQISVIGTAAEVPAAAALLLDKDLSDYARYALERIPLPEAVAAVRAAMPKATERMKVGMINTLGVRRDAPSVSALAGLVADKDAMIAGAAAAALGKIGGTDAAKALADFRGKAPAELKAIVTDAYLVAADQFVKDGKKDAAEAIYKEIYVPAESKAVRVAALTGLVATQGEKALALLAPLMTGDDAQMQVIALRLAQGIPGAEATKALAAMLPKLPAGAQIMLANQLGERGDAAAAPALIEAAKSDNENLRVAALRALGGVGDVSTIPVLVKAAAVGSTAGAATDALGRLKGADVDAALVKTLDGAEVPVKSAVIQALAARKSVAAMPEVVKALARCRCRRPQDGRHRPRRHGRRQGRLGPHRLRQQGREAGRTGRRREGAGGDMRPRGRPGQGRRADRRSGRRRQGPGEGRAPARHAEGRRCRRPRGREGGAQGRRRPDGRGGLARAGRLAGCRRRPGSARPCQE